MCTDRSAEMGLAFGIFKRKYSDISRRDHLLKEATSKIGQYASEHIRGLFIK